MKVIRGQGLHLPSILCLFLFGRSIAGETGLCLPLLYSADTPIPCSVFSYTFFTLTEYRWQVALVYHSIQFVLDWLSDKP